MNILNETMEDTVIELDVDRENASLSRFLQSGCAAAVLKRQTPRPTLIKLLIETQVPSI